MTRDRDRHTYEACAALNVRLYQTQIINGEARRVQRSRKLCAKDQRQHSCAGKARPACR